MAKMDEIPVFYAANRATWREWLHKNHETKTGIWLLSYRKETGIPSVKYDDLEYWEQFSKSSRKGILEWILNAKTAETRAKRILETASLAAQNVKANQYVKKL